LCESDEVEDGHSEHLRVSFPADGSFGRVGRVAVSGLALRLGFDVAEVERLRGAVDTAVGLLAGTGRITLVASWTPSSLALEVANPDADLDEERCRQARLSLGEWLDDTALDRGTVRLVVPAP
jgi:hypothetical protein